MLLKKERNDLVQKNICYDGNIDCDGIEGTRQDRILWQFRQCETYQAQWELS